MMLLCDCINMKIEPNLIDLVKCLGDIYEYEITLARDTSKWNKYIYKIINLVLLSLKNQIPSYIGFCKMINLWLEINLSKNLLEFTQKF